MREDVPCLPASHVKRRKEKDCESRCFVRGKCMVPAHLAGWPLW